MSRGLDKCLHYEFLVCRSLCAGAGTLEALHSALREAVEACPNSVVLWLMRAKEQWMAGNVPEARAVLEAAHSCNSDSEEIVLAAFKLEFENAEPERARLIARRAQETLADPSARVWIKAAMVARALGNDSVLLRLNSACVLVCKGPIARRNRQLRLLTSMCRSSARCWRVGSRASRMRPSCT